MEGISEDESDIPAAYLVISINILLIGAILAHHQLNYWVDMLIK